MTAGRELPEPLRAALPTLPELMAASDAVAGKVTRACVDRTEASLLADRVGDELDVVVLRPSGPDGEPGEVYLPQPPVLARCHRPAAGRRDHPGPAHRGRPGDRSDRVRRAR